ncbi:fibronectin type III domain-containing protein [Pseudoalteromonas aurantia]|uniref:Fibronectin type III domain protein n=1 Tax=Pseudoalteromonas aurantia 208 TaxID=1314867 RepID=A0ABR9EE76_9GAMM|nr:hypothetical protein [Pseudoalteromonas aurantia]MBE0368570.1 hypothetical protein [Pseudoalteromonas aurantia 208]
MAAFISIKCVANDLYLPVLIDYVNDDAPPMHSGYVDVPSESSDGNYEVKWHVDGYHNNYILEESTDSGASWSIIYQGDSTYSTQSKLTSGTYFYRVKSCEAQGCTNFVYSRPILVNALAQGPSNVVAIQQGNNINVSWSETSFTNAKPISETMVQRFLRVLMGQSANRVQYEVYESKNGQEYQFLQSTQQTSVMLTADSSATFRYMVRLCYLDLTKCSRYSPPSNGVGGLEAPKSVTATSDAIGITVNWSPVDSGNIDVRYVVERSLNSGSWVVVSQTGTSEYVEIAPVYGVHTYRVKSCDATTCYEVSHVTRPIKIVENNQCTQAMGRLSVYSDGSNYYLKRFTTEWQSKFIPGVALIPYDSRQLIKQQQWKITPSNTQASGYQINALSAAVFNGIAMTKVDKPLECSVNLVTNETLLSLHDGTAKITWAVKTSVANTYADNFFETYASDGQITLSFDKQAARLLWAAPKSKVSTYELEYAICNSACLSSGVIDWKKLSDLPNTQASMIVRNKGLPQNMYVFRIRGCLNSQTCYGWSNTVRASVDESSLGVELDIFYIEGAEDYYLKVPISNSSEFHYIKVTYDGLIYLTKNQFIALRLLMKNDLRAYYGNFSSDDIEDVVIRDNYDLTAFQLTRKGSDFLMEFMNLSEKSGVISWNTYPNVKYYKLEYAQCKGDCVSLGSELWNSEKITKNINSSRVDYTMPEDMNKKYLYRVTGCYTDEKCRGWSNYIKVGNSKKEVIFIHTDLLGSPVAETQL